MRILLWNHVENAKQSIKSNRMRSLLTMTGITIGVASITTILALSGGATRLVQSQIDSLGGTIAVVKPGAKTPSNKMVNEAISSQQLAASTLTQADIKTISETKHVTAVAPIMVLHGSINGDEKAPAATPIVATTPDFIKLTGIEVRDGQFLDDELTISAAVIGPQLSIDIYGTEHSIGKTINIKGKSFTVVGVLARESNPINYNSIDSDASAFISLESGQALNQGAIQLQQINIQSESVANLTSVVTSLNKELLRNHLGEADFSVLSGSEISQPTSKMFTTVAGAAVAIAAISLIVGGVGVMNIMLVSVAERTREIGIRKALGATNGEIVMQFIMESLFLGLGGGVAGYLLGYALAFGFSLLLTFSPILNWQIAACAAVLSLVVGVLFGIYPALKAAKKDPISALRQYE